MKSYRPERPEILLRPEFERPEIAFFHGFLLYLYVK